MIPNKIEPTWISNGIVNWQALADVPVDQTAKFPGNVCKVAFKLFVEKFNGPFSVAHAVFTAEPETKYIHGTESCHPAYREKNPFYGFDAFAMAKALSYMISMGFSDYEYANDPLDKRLDTALSAYHPDLHFSHITVTEKGLERARKYGFSPTRDGESCYVEIYRTFKGDCAKNPMDWAGTKVLKLLHDNGGRISSSSLPQHLNHQSEQSLYDLNAGMNTRMSAVTGGGTELVPGLQYTTAAQGVRHVLVRGFAKTKKLPGVGRNDFSLSITDEGRAFLRDEFEIA